ERAAPAEASAAAPANAQIRHAVIVASPSAIAATSMAPTAGRGNAVTKAVVLALLLAAAAPVLAAPAAPVKKTPPLADILAASPASDWRPIDQARLLYMQLPTGRVLIELAPEFAPNHVDNIRRLASAGFFDHVAIVRAQDNFVVQWGAPEGQAAPPLGDAKPRLAPEFTRPAKGLAAFTRLPDPDAYAPQTGFVAGFAAARNPATGRAWLTHCYGTVAVGRENAADSGNGGELYAVIGPARHLDRNLTVVGRVVEGMPLLASRPRGDAALGFYSKPADVTPVRLRFGTDMPAAERASLETLRTDSKTFATVIDARRNRHDDFYAVPPGGVDVCNVPLPVRPKPGGP
ncbi:MAG: peptidylprolyl isomerase, partial [Caulobacteraceae bacterium]|nr:peptidylprolyl isomerase [Caulobacteraceae bacterium]